MITPVTRRGFLIDWELSRLAIELESGAVEPDRSVSLIQTCAWHSMVLIIPFLGDMADAFCAVQTVSAQAVPPFR